MSTLFYFFIVFVPYAINNEHPRPIISSPVTVVILCDLVRDSWVVGVIRQEEVLNRTCHRNSIVKCLQVVEVATHPEKLLE